MTILPLCTPLRGGPARPMRGIVRVAARPVEPSDDPRSRARPAAEPERPPHPDAGARWSPELRAALLAIAGQDHVRLKRYPRGWAYPGDVTALILHAKVAWLERRGLVAISPFGGRAIAVTARGRWYAAALLAAEAEQLMAAEIER